MLSAVQPDLLFLADTNRHILKEDGHIHGAPDMIVEILSLDKKRDTVKKKSLYERAGAKEYFILDPADKKVLCYCYENDKYKLLYENIGVFKSHLLDLTFSF